VDGIADDFTMGDGIPAVRASDGWPPDAKSRMKPENGDASQGSDVLLLSLSEESFAEAYGGSASLESEEVAMGEKSPSCFPGVSRAKLSKGSVKEKDGAKGTSGDLLAFWDGEKRA